MGVDWNSPKHQADRKRHEATMRGYQGQPNIDSHNIGAHQMGASIRASSRAPSNSAPLGPPASITIEDWPTVLRWAGALVLLPAGVIVGVGGVAIFVAGKPLTLAQFALIAAFLSMGVIGALSAKKLLDLQTQKGRSTIGWLLGPPALVIGVLIGHRAIFRFTSKIFWDEVLVSLAFLIPGAFLLLRAILKKKKKTGA